MKAVHDKALKTVDIVGSLFTMMASADYHFILVVPLHQDTVFPGLILNYILLSRYRFLS